MGKTALPTGLAPKRAVVWDEVIAIGKGLVNVD
jgi:hypothetical protein